MNKNQNFFKILADGKFAPDQIEIEVVPGLLKRDPESESIMENGWQKMLNSGFHQWKGDTRPSRYYFSGVKFKNNKLIITADPSVSYRDIMGARNAGVDNLKKNRLPLWIGASMAIIAKSKSGEKSLGVTIRNHKSDYKPGGYHVTCGGAVEIKNGEKIIDAALREAKEEIGIDPEEFDEITCSGIIFNPCSLDASVNFIATTRLPIKKILAKKHDDENKIFFIPADRENIEKLLLGTPHASTGDGLAVLLSIGKDMFGEKWRKKMADKLADAIPKYANAAQMNKLEYSDIQKFNNLKIS